MEQREPATGGAIPNILLSNATIPNVETVLRAFTILTIIIVGIISFVFCYFIALVIWQDRTEPIPTDASSFTQREAAEVFEEYVLDYQSRLEVSKEVTQIEAVEGYEGFGITGPAFLKFRATDAFINELLQRESDFGVHGNPSKYSSYTPMTCTFFQKSSLHPLMEKSPHRFEWWKTSGISSPICYGSSGDHYNDGVKYVLIDRENNIVYFYNSEICQMCQD